MFPRLENLLRELDSQKSRILVHAASMGEFEQARPVLRALRRQFPGHILIVSVFSPSAYENVRNHPEADIVTYLPFDSLHASRKFLNIIRPKALLFTRYDLWPNLIWEARRRKIHTVLFDASLQETSMRHKPLIRQFNHTVFGALDMICAISDAAAILLRQSFYPSTPMHVTGDTRFDQAVYRAKEKQISEILPGQMAKWQQTVIAGSTWPEDEEIILPGFAKLKKTFHDARLILVPHELSEAHLSGNENTCRQFELQCQRLSKVDEKKATDVLIVDRMGVLANIYAAGQIAFVGGSFGPGVHSVIEAAAHAIPVLFGPRMQNSPEAVDMVDSGCGFVVKTSDKIFALCGKWFSDPNVLHNVSNISAQFVANRIGASEKIIALIANQLRR
ncbi:MAG: 3-deoxy-D-manno-octulosonic acid transferase [bacterium]